MEKYNGFDQSLMESMNLRAEDVIMYDPQYMINLMHTYAQMAQGMFFASCEIPSEHMESLRDLLQTLGDLKNREYKLEDAFRKRHDQECTEEEWSMYHMLDDTKDATKEQKDEFWKNQEIFQINWRAAKKSLACDQKYTIQIRLSMRPMINEMERLAGMSLGVLFLLQRTYNEDTDTASTISEEEMLDIWNMLQKLDEGRRTIELAWKGLILGEIEEWKKVKEATYIQTTEKDKKEMNEAREALAKTTEATFDIWESMMKKK